MMQVQVFLDDLLTLGFLSSILQLIYNALEIHREIVALLIIQ